MKAKELMIGDWAYIKEYPMRAEAKRVTASHFTQSLCESEPIPLTDWILKKNGWNTKLDNGGFSPQYICDNDNICVTIDAIHHCLDIRIDDINYDMPRPKYVHELQHALRLCGLNELADNFKLE